MSHATYTVSCLLWRAITCTARLLMAALVCHSMPSTLENLFGMLLNNKQLILLFNDIYFHSLAHNHVTVADDVKEGIGVRMCSRCDLCTLMGPELMVAVF